MPALEHGPDGEMVELDPDGAVYIEEADGTLIRARRTQPAGPSRATNGHKAPSSNPTPARHPDSHYPQCSGCTTARPCWSCEGAALGRRMKRYV